MLVCVLVKSWWKINTSIRPHCAFHFTSLSFPVSSQMRLVKVFGARGMWSSSKHTSFTVHDEWIMYTASCLRFYQTLLAEDWEVTEFGLVGLREAEDSSRFVASQRKCSPSCIKEPQMWHWHKQQLRWFEHCWCPSPWRWKNNHNAQIFGQWFWPFAPVCQMGLFAKTQKRIHFTLFLQVAWIHNETCLFLYKQRNHSHHANIL